MKLSSAMANKMIKQLMEDKEALIREERETCTTSYTEGEAAVDEKEYDFQDTQRKIADIDDRVMALRHAINMFNTTTPLPGLNMTIDQALVRMAMLNEHKSRLRSMKQTKPFSRRVVYSGVIEYTRTNYSEQDAQKEYNRVSDELTKIQLALDKANLLGQFEVDI